jgi:hypothetical protein
VDFGAVFAALGETLGDGDTRLHDDGGKRAYERNRASVGRAAVHGFEGTSRLGGTRVN